MQTQQQSVVFDVELGALSEIEAVDATPHLVVVGFLVRLLVLVFGLAAARALVVSVSVVAPAAELVALFAARLDFADDFGAAGAAPADDAVKLASSEAAGGELFHASSE